MTKKYKKLSIDFPAEEYIYLKLTCSKKNVTIKDYVTKLIIDDVLAYEDHLLSEKYKNRKEMGA